MRELIHPELSYRVRGVLLDVYNALGPMLNEEYYRDAIVLGLQACGVRCEAEKSFEVCYKDERAGLYYVDVWIEGGKVLLELKVAPTIEPIHKAQAISYLKVTDADLAVVVNFGGPSLEDERLPNFVRGGKAAFTDHLPAARPDLLHSELVSEIELVCHRVQFGLGPGFLHQVYRRAVLIELQRSALDREYLKRLPVLYQGHLLGQQDVRLILVEGKILLATFALRQVDDAAVERLKSYLRRLDLKVGLLANFYATQPAIIPVCVK